MPFYPVFSEFQIDLEKSLKIHFLKKKTQKSKRRPSTVRSCVFFSLNFCVSSLKRHELRNNKIHTVRSNFSPPAAKKQIQYA
jgi:hypothetical protein